MSGAYLADMISSYTHCRGQLGTALMDFLIASRQEIRDGLVVRQPYAVISISDPDKPRPRIRRPATFRGVLHVQFHDAVPVDDFELPEEVVLMTADHAREIWQFVDRYRTVAKLFLVHCEQGASRSPAVAAAIAKVLGEDESRFFKEYVPNEYVYKLLLSVKQELDASG